MTRLPTNVKDLVEFCTARCLAVNAGDNLLCRVLGCKPFYTPVADVAMSSHFAMSGFWEPALTVFLTRLVQPGWRWADIGANVGYFTCLLSELTSDAPGMSYEPNPVTFDCLTKNRIANGCWNARCVQSGISTKYRQSYPFLRSTMTMGGASLYRSPYVDETTEEFHAELMTLNNADEFDVVKIDAEGEDLPIVLSWDRMPKHTVIEYAGKFKHVPELLPALFDRCRVQLIDDEGNARVTTVQEVIPLDVATLYLQPK